MIGPCPYACSNKTDYGYCKTTGCINIAHQHMVFSSNANSTIPVPTDKKVPMTVILDGWCLEEEEE